MKLSLSLETTEVETGALCETLSESRGASFDVGAAVSALGSIVTAYLASTPVETETPSEPPPTRAQPGPVENPEKKAARRQRGSEHFYTLVSAWRQGFGEDVEQPDRQALLREVSTGPAAGDILEFVSSVGGIIRATNLAVLPAEWLPEDERRNIVSLVASNITQVASILFPDLAEQYEHRNIYQ